MYLASIVLSIPRFHLFFPSMPSSSRGHSASSMHVYSSLLYFSVHTSPPPSCPCVYFLYFNSHPVPSPPLLFLLLLLLFAPFYPLLLSFRRVPSTCLFSLSLQSSAFYETRNRYRGGHDSVNAARWDFQATIRK